MHPFLPSLQHKGLCLLYAILVFWSPRVNLKLCQALQPTHTRHLPTSSLPGPDTPKWTAPVQTFREGRRRSPGNPGSARGIRQGARPIGGKKNLIVLNLIRTTRRRGFAGAAGDEDQGARNSRRSRWADRGKQRSGSLWSRWNRTSDSDATLPRPWPDLQELWTDQPLRQGLQESSPEEFCERREVPGQEPRRLLWREGREGLLWMRRSPQTTTFPWRMEIPMEDGDTRRMRMPR